MSQKYSQSLSTKLAEEKYNLNVDDLMNEEDDDDSDSDLALDDAELSADEELA